VLAVCDGSLRDLQSYRRRTRYQAGRGGHGSGALRHGADGQTLRLAVPPGTRIEAAPGEQGPLAGRSWELLTPGASVLLARGGGGGSGNKHFATATRQTPRFAERGLPGEEGWLALQLRLLADVGLVGLPNAGKSSLLARLTRAAPKIADYPFTTLSPVLGVLESDDRQLVIADIPGLIEGASEGAGLGHEFLAHIERTRLLVHVLDVAPQLTQGEGADPLQNYATIERELAAYDPRLASLPRVLALSKSDLVDEATIERELAGWRQRLGREIPVLACSSATGAGVRALAGELLSSVPPESPGVTQAPGEQPSGVPAAGEHELAEHMVFRPRPREGFQVERLHDNAFAVRGRGIERLLERFDLDNDEALAHLEERLRSIGVIKALEKEGFRPGDEVEIAGVTFELDPR